MKIKLGFIHNIDQVQCASHRNNRLFCNDCSREMMSHMRIGLSLSLLSCLILAVAAAVVAQVTGSTTLTVGTSAKPTSLLAGMTPGNLKVPSGWTMVATQDFESGSVPANQGLGQATRITNTFGHTGTHSAFASIAYNQASASWFVNSSAVGSYSDIYISWYDFKESQGRLNDEFFVATLVAADNLSDIVWDYFGGGNSASHSGFNAMGASFIQTWEYQTNPNLNILRYGPGRTVQWGSWEQIEIWVHPNTGSNHDGFENVYFNGQLFWSATNIEITNNVPISPSSVQIGGVYTKATWVHADGSCGAWIGDGTDGGPAVGSFSVPLPCPNQGPPNGFVPIFERHIDDIIVMKK